MKCPYCGVELECVDYYGGYLGNDKWDKQGDIYKCPNSNGFDNEYDAVEYAMIHNIRCNDWHDICCDSESFDGYFSTDKDNELHEGYPC